MIRVVEETIYSLIRRTESCNESRVVELMFFFSFLFSPFLSFSFGKDKITLKTNKDARGGENKMPKDYKQHTTAKATTASRPPQTATPNEESH